MAPKKTLNTKQIRLVKTAARAVGLCGNRYSRDQRYYVLLSQYKRSNSKPVESCKQLTAAQMDDFLVICESMGWRHPGKSETHYRDRASKDVYNGGGSFAQIEAIKHLAGDLGMTEENLKKFVRRMTRHRTDSLLLASQKEAWVITEAMKAMLSRKDGTNYQTLADVESAYQTETTDGKANQNQG